MKVTINGGTAELPEGATVGDAVRTLTSLMSGVAVALNGEVVSRSAWDSTQVADGDGVEVLTAVQGG
ncbi:MULTISPECIES: sulfur carrier protein ThiS [unclassified Microbispora]|uniref:sulfur carrier protein ThiS n=1 Tax=unclassified Microbispora TaxID=2614687 RepID=UPI00147672B4|nr:MULTISPECIES: sulfur carrier protein ThiS [unclassified Microbispora]